MKWSSLWLYTHPPIYMKAVDALDLGHSEIIDHNDPNVVKYILGAVADA